MEIFLRQISQPLGSQLIMPWRMLKFVFMNQIPSPHMSFLPLSIVPPPIPPFEGFQNAWSIGMVSHNILLQTKGPILQQMKYSTGHMSHWICHAPVTQKKLALRILGQSLKDSAKVLFYNKEFEGLCFWFPKQGSKSLGFSKWQEWPCYVNEVTRSRPLDSFRMGADHTRKINHVIRGARVWATWYQALNFWRGSGGD